MLDASLTIHVDGVYGKTLLAHIEGVYGARISYFVHEDSKATYDSVKGNLHYLGSVLENTAFHIRLPLQSRFHSLHIALFAQSTRSEDTAFLNYHIPFNSVFCNDQVLTFQKVTDLRDSCLEVTLSIKGEGDIYLLGGSFSGAPLGSVIVNEGVFLGQWAGVERDHL